MMAFPGCVSALVDLYGDPDGEGTPEPARPTRRDEEQLTLPLSHAPAVRHLLSRIEADRESNSGD